MEFLGFDVRYEQKRGLPVELVGSASGGLLFPRGKSNQKRAETKVLESLSGRQAGYL